MTNVALYGLGAMGYGMAQSLLRAGHAVQGFDLRAEAVARLQSEGGSAALEPAGLDAVVVVVLNAAQTEAVLFGPDGIVPKLRDGALVMACATVPPEFARSMEARCAEHGVHYLDAPISGGAAKAASGQLSIMASGRLEAFAAAGPVLEACAETVFELGDEAGPGSAMKAVNQLLAGCPYRHHGRGPDLWHDPGRQPPKLCRGDQQMRWHQHGCWKTARLISWTGDYTPLSQINIWPKDLGIVLEIAKSGGLLRTRSRRRRCSNTWSPSAWGWAAKMTRPSPRSMRATPASPCREMRNEARLYRR